MLPTRDSPWSSGHTEIESKGMEKYFGQIETRSRGRNTHIRQSRL